MSLYDIDDTRLLEPSPIPPALFPTLRFVGADANEVLAPRLSLLQLPVVDWPEDDDSGRLHWKTRRLVEWAAGRRFVWVDDEITDADRTWVATNYKAPALLHRVNARRGLADADYCAITQWLKEEGFSA